MASSGSGRLCRFCGQAAGVLSQEWARSLSKSPALTLLPVEGARTPVGEAMKSRLQIRRRFQSYKRDGHCVTLGTIRESVGVAALQILTGLATYSWRVKFRFAAVWRRNHSEIVTTAHAHRFEVRLCGRHFRRAEKWLESCSKTRDRLPSTRGGTQQWTNDMARLCLLVRLYQPELSVV
jgi:hypothetical protein